MALHASFLKKKNIINLGIRIVLDSYLGVFGDFSVITEIQWGSVAPIWDADVGTVPQAFGCYVAHRRCGTSLCGLGIVFRREPYRKQAAKVVCVCEF